jgi:hypothetical protein
MLGTVSVILRKKSAHTEAFRGLRKSQFQCSKRNEITGKKCVLLQNPAPENRIESVFSPVKCFGMEFREFASVFVPWNRIPSCFCFLIRGIVASFCYGLLLNKSCTKF